MNKLLVTPLQCSLAWKNREKNLHYFEQSLESIKYTDLVILPEMFTTGFSMEAEELAEEWENSYTKNWIQSMAKKYGFAICGSVIIQDKGQFYNRLLFAYPDGRIHTYDKRHLFRMAGEDEHYSAGSEKLVLEYKGWKICPMVCYDLRFPVWSRNIDLEYDLLIYVANWPKPRADAWRSLLKARSIENLSYVIGVNRIGTDGNNVDYSGDSSVFDFKGTELFHSKDQEINKTLELDMEDLKAFRNKFPAHLDADHFIIHAKK